ncbi:MAG: 2Fe-2S iron-sulfur cluster binding domain-containing protein [Saprospiraceae bacterium]|nr:2Fe-2S iron-sulfur cluster binding domain-containing protein [Saprospiraceae bacterium]
MESPNIFITVVDRQDIEHSIEIPTDMSLNLMEVCKASELPVKGTCGGMALCSTCHVYVLSDHELPEMTMDEEIILDQAFFVQSMGLGRLSILNNLSALNSIEYF